MVVLNSIGVDTYSNTYVTGELRASPRALVNIDPDRLHLRVKLERVDS